MTDWVFRALGLFWLLGGLFALRVFAQGRPIDATIAALGEGWGRRHRIRATFQTGGAVLTATAGASLLLLDRTAPALMIVNAIVQGVWLVVSPRLFPHEDESDRLGWARMRNALAIWVVATGGLFAAVGGGALTLGGTLLDEAIGAGVALLVFAHQMREIVFGATLFPGIVAAGFASDDEDEREREGRSISVFAPRRWMLAPDLYGAGMIDLDTDERWFVESIDLPDELVERIRAFEDAVVGALEPDDRAEDGWMLPDTVRADFEARAAALAAELGPHTLGGVAVWRLPPGPADLAGRPVADAT